MFASCTDLPGPSLNYVLLIHPPEPSIQQVAQAQPGMFPEHPRAGEPHHVLDLFESIPLVAMHRAFRAGRLIRAKPATIQPQADVEHQPLTLLAQWGAVFLATVDVDHRGNGFPFTPQPAIWELNGG